MTEGAKDKKDEKAWLAAQWVCPSSEYEKDWGKNGLREGYYVLGIRWWEMKLWH